MDAIEIPKIIDSNGETIIVEMTIEQFNDFMTLIIQSTADEEYNAGYEFGCAKQAERRGMICCKQHSNTSADRKR